MSTYEVANELDFFNECLDKLIQKLFFRDIGREHDIEVPETHLKKSAWVASLLASSKEEEHKKKALSFGILAYLENRNQDEELYRQYLYIILSRLGNLPSMENLFENGSSDRRENFEEELSTEVDSILGLELLENKVPYELDGNTVISEFQEEIWRKLNSEGPVAISGPTSSGKSFIIQKYIERRLEENGEFSGIYVVPTKALISEVSSDLRDELGDEVKIRTGAYLEDLDEEENKILVLTQERCLDLLDGKQKQKFNPELIFLDEIQNLEGDQRGVLLEKVVTALNQLWDSAKIVAAGPYLENPEDILEELIEEEPHTIVSNFTPVLQLRTEVKFRSTSKRKNRKVDVEIDSPSGEKIRLELPEPENLTTSTLNQSMTTALPDLYREYAHEEQSIIYAGKKNVAENRAKKIAEMEGREDREDEFSEIIEFLSNTIHDQYPLIECLNKGVAYHHGRVPKIVREEIEEMYEGGHLDTIVCTSTLLEGVNLPAEKIFVLEKKQGDRKLSNFSYQNLVGRVGRMNSKLYGSIFKIETEKTKDDGDEYDESEKKEVTSSTTKALSDHKDSLISNITESDLNSVEDCVQYTIILLRGKGLKKDESVSEYLKNKEDSNEEVSISSDEINQIEQELNELNEQIDVPESILSSNPTIDPIKQNKLYRSVKRQPEKWVIDRGSDITLKSQFSSITKNLNEIFRFVSDHEREIELESQNTETKHHRIEAIEHISYQWLKGENYRSMIEKRQKYTSSETVNGSINNVIDIVNQDISHVLVKYYRLLTDILEESEKDVGEFMLNFDKRLERGALNTETLKMMSLGIDRSIANDISLPKDLESLEDIEEHLKAKKSNYRELYRRHLSNQGI